MGTSFVPLTPELIDEGEFLKDFAAELAAIQRGLAEYRKTHGEKSLKAKAKLTIDIELAIHSVEDEAYTIKASMKATHPKRPASVSLAIEGFNDADQPVLFVRGSGSDSDDPRQGKLSTRDGRAINPGTGEPFDDDADASETGDGKSAAAGD